MRVAQVLLNPGVTSYIGCIGTDHLGDMLSRIIKEDGLDALYLVDPIQPTGNCIVLISSNGKHRSLIANLSAAQCYQLDHTLTSPVHLKLQSAAIVYITGYFLQVSCDTVYYVFDYCQQNSKITCFNLSAPFICEQSNDKILKILPWVDFLFANQTELLAFAKINHIEDLTLQQIIHKIVHWNKISPKKERIVIITNGSLSTYVGITGQETIQILVDPLPIQDIVDTTGAGDAFVGGFLSQLIQNKSIEECVQMGHRIAGKIITHVGVNTKTLRNVLKLF